jgi:hypothetical protein
VYNRAAVGPGNVLSTVGDLLKWAGNLAHPVVGDARLIARLTEPVALTDGTRIGYGFALKRSWIAGHEVIVHDGGISGFQGLFSYFPSDDFAVVILSNGTVNDSAILEKIVALYLPAASAPAAGEADRPVQPDGVTLRALPGHYQSVDGRMLTLELRDGAVLAKDVAATKGQLTFHADGSFHVGTRRRSVFSIERAGDGQVTALVERMIGGADDSPNVTSAYRTRRHERVQLAMPSAKQLAQLTGRYRSDAIDITYTVWIDSGRLMLSTLWMTEPQALVATGPDRFDSLSGPLSGLTLTVRPGRGGVPAQIIMHYANVRNLPFTQVAGS